MVEPPRAVAMETAIPVAASSESETDEEPDDNDVVLGRGKRYQYHPGNLVFQGTYRWRHWAASFSRQRNALILSHTLVLCRKSLTELVYHHRQRYFAASDPFERRAILEEIVDVILRQPGRFVKQDKKSGEWQSISRSDAVTKTARAMQYQARHVKAAVADHAVGASSREYQSVVDPPSPSILTHDNQMLSPRAEYSPFQAPQDPVIQSPGWATHVPLSDLGIPLEHYYSYRAWLNMNHPSQSEPVCRRVSEMRENETLRLSQFYVPLLHHRYQSQLSSLHNADHYSQMYYTNANSLTPFQNVPLVTCPSSPNTSHPVVLPVHDLSGILDDSVRTDGDDEHCCATSLGSFNSEYELEQLDRDMKW
jgi:hypothetical protein